MKRSVVIYRHTLGKASEPWVWTQCSHFTSFHPFFLAREIEAAFPQRLEGAAFLPDPTAKISRVRHGVFGAPDLALKTLAVHEVSPRLIHAHFGFDGIYAAEIAARLRVPLFVTLHGIDVAATNQTLLTSAKLAWWKYLVGRDKLGRAAQRFLCVSEHVKRLAAVHFPEEKLKVAYLGIDAKKFSPAPFNSSHSILFVGRLVEKKGAEFLVRAFRQVRQKIPQAKLTLVGTGPLEESVKRVAAECEVSSAISFIPRVTQDEMIPLVASHRAFCLPSVTAKSGDTEGLPISILEAMATARPVISTLHAGIPEAVRDGRDGILVPERAVEQLTGALIRVLENDELAAALGVSARQQVEQKFEISQCARVTESLYREVLDQTTPATL